MPSIWNSANICQCLTLACSSVCTVIAHAASSAYTLVLLLGQLLGPVRVIHNDIKAYSSVGRHQTHAYAVFFASSSHSCHQGVAGHRGCHFELSSKLWNNSSRSRVGKGWGRARRKRQTAPTCRGSMQVLCTSDTTSAQQPYHSNDEQ